MFFWPWKNQLPVESRLVVITGGSQGMGLAVAIQMARKGAHVAIIARDQRKLDVAINEIRDAALDSKNQRFTAVSADMSLGSAARRAFEYIVAQNNGAIPDIVWTCTGGARLGLLADLSAEHLESQVRTNYYSALFAAHAALQLMTKNPLPAGSPRRHIIFTASVLSFYSIIGYSSYSPCKAAIRSLADTLKQECLLYDIDVHCCFPASIDSPGFMEEQRTKHPLTKKIEEKDGIQSPEEVARICIKKLEQGQYLITTTFLGSVLRATSWGGSVRNNVIFDIIFAWIVITLARVVTWTVDNDVITWSKANKVSQSANNGEQTNKVSQPANNGEQTKKRFQITY